jgi:Holliday junction DNA helicase RuvB subunit
MATHVSLEAIFVMLIGGIGLLIIFAILAAVSRSAVVQERNRQQLHNAEQVPQVQTENFVETPSALVTPKSFSTFVGQTRIKTRLEMAIAAARSRGDVLGHVLLLGSPGSGKATLAQIIANAMGANIKNTSGPLIQRAGELAGLLTSLEKGDILFIDDIHQLSRTIDEYLYPAMHDFRLDIIIDYGLPQARPLRLNLPKFTLVGTAPRQERVHRELVSCFQIIENMAPYVNEELVTIARQFADDLKLEIDDRAALLVARSSDGTPLDLLNRLRHIRDYAHVKSFAGTVTADTTVEALKLLPSPESVRGRQAIPSEVRQEVWRRDRGTCAKCGSRENLEYDHIIPIAKGGSNTARNIELLCEVCNRSKRDSII